MYNRLFQTCKKVLKMLKVKVLHHVFTWEIYNFKFWILNMAFPHIWHLFPPNKKEQSQDVSSVHGNNFWNNSRIDAIFGILVEITVCCYRFKKKLQVICYHFLETDVIRVRAQKDKKHKIYFQCIEVRDLDVCLHK